MSCMHLPGVFCDNCRWPRNYGDGASAPQVYPQQVWTGVTVPDGLATTVFREREVFRDALKRIRGIADEADEPDLGEALDQITEVVDAALQHGTDPGDGRSSP